MFNLTDISFEIYAEEVDTYLNDQIYQHMKREKLFTFKGKKVESEHKQIESAKSNEIKEQKQTNTYSSKLHNYKQSQSS